MFKKKVKILDTAIDLRIKALVNQIADKNWALISDVEKCIIRNGVIALYPDGADKDKVIKDAEYAKHSLLCRIGAYDRLMRDYDEALAKPNGRRTTTGWRNNFSKSHELVEITYRNFYNNT